MPHILSFLQARNIANRGTSSFRNRRGQSSLSSNLLAMLINSIRYRTLRTLLKFSLQMVAAAEPSHIASPTKDQNVLQALESKRLAFQPFVFVRLADADLTENHSTHALCYSERAIETRRKIPIHDHNGSRRNCSRDWE